MVQTVIFRLQRQIITVLSILVFTLTRILSFQGDVIFMSMFYLVSFK